MISVEERIDAFCKERKHPYSWGEHDNGKRYATIMITNHEAYSETLKAAKELKGVHCDTLAQGPRDTTEGKHPSHIWLGYIWLEALKTEA